MKIAKNILKNILILSIILIVYTLLKNKLYISNIESLVTEGLTSQKVTRGLTRPKVTIHQKLL